MIEITTAIRRLRRDPWTAAAAVLVAALGAGLNTAVFAIAYGVLLRPLPYAQANRLVIVNAAAPFVQISEWRRQLPAFERMAGYARDRFTVRGAGEPRLAAVALVDDEFFDTLEARPLAGRLFRPGDPIDVAVVSEQFARQAGGSPEALVGRTLTLGTTAVTVVAVTPAAFAVPSERVDAWMPAAAAPGIAFDRSEDARRFQIVGRLRPGASLDQARDDAARARRAMDPDADPRTAGPDVRSLHAVVTGGVRPVLIAFAFAASIVLIVACSNVASILIGRTVARERDLAVRRALGASPGRLMMSVLSESAAIAVAGAALGVLLAAVAVRVVERWAAGVLPRLGEISLDWVALLFACAIAALASVLGALPALRAVRAGGVSLRAGGAVSSGGGVWTRSALIVIQIALAVVLLTSGALLTRTIVGLLRSDVGIDSRGATVSQLMLMETTRFDAAGRAPLLAEVLQRVRALPGVVAAGAGSDLPPDNAGIEMHVRLVDGTKEAVHVLSLGTVTPGFLQAVGARLLAGRHFQEGDERRDRPVVVISRSAARALIEQPDPVGRELPMSLIGPMRRRGHPIVIGVVDDIKYAGLAGPAGPTIYAMWNELPTGQPYLVVRGAPGAAAVLAPAVRAILRELDPGIPVQPSKALDEVLAGSIADRRLRALLAGSVACLAFAVALVGLAGGLVRVVSERRYELAIRAALGATPARAVRMIMTEGAALAAAGLVLGIAGALATGQALRTLLHGVGPHDPLTFAAVAVFVSAATMAACYLPARRAARVDPLELLRAD